MAISGITNFLWFDDQALEAATFYTSIFPHSSLGDISYYLEDSFKPAGSVLTVSFTVMGQAFSALNGGPQFPHSEAISFQVHCDTQEEVDYLWDSIVADGGAESQCGWCKDRFGVSWQIVPRKLGEKLGNPDPEVSQRAFTAMMGMRKIIIADLG